MASYKVVYWPGFLGRSEAAVLMLEDAGASYTVDNNVNDFLSKNTGYPAFACPVVVKNEGNVVVAQSVAGAAFLGKELGYSPAPEHEIHALQLALNLSDIVTEAWKAKTSAEGKQAFLEGGRLGKWLDTVERSLAAGGGDGPFSFGSKPVWVDFLMTDAHNGLAFFFGEPYTSLVQERPRIKALLAAIEALPGVAAFRASERNVIKLPDTFK